MTSHSAFHSGVLVSLLVNVRKAIPPGPPDEPIIVSPIGLFSFISTYALFVFDNYLFMSFPAHTLIFNDPPSTIVFEPDGN